MYLKRSVVFGLLAGAALAAQATAATIIIDSLPAGQVTTWSASNKYILQGKVLVRPGSQLVIPAGTKVLGALGTGGSLNTLDSGVSMLLVCRGAKLYAQGTAANPVIFTSVLDTMGVPLPISNLTRGLWGGLYIEGRAPNNQPGGVTLTGGGDLTVPSADTGLFSYGDSTPNPHDTSGILSYVSVRYAGAADQATLKGLSFLSVGDGTQLDHIENFECNDDGIDFLGGTVNIKYLSSAFQAGDAVYYDIGYRGKMQFVFAYQDTITGGTSLGCCSKIEANDYTGYQPFTFGQVYNATYIGTGATNKDTWKYKYGIYYKKNGAGQWVNSILTQCYQYGLYIENLGTADSVQIYNCWARFMADSIVLKGDIFYGFGGGNVWDSICKGNLPLAAYMAADSNMNDTIDPAMGGFDWGRDGILDPRPSATGVAVQHVATVPNDGFFTQTSYRGAFNPTGQVWGVGWTELATTGFFTSAATGVKSNGHEGIRPEFKNLSIVGAGDTRLLSWEQPTSGHVTISLHKLNGQRVSMLEDGAKCAGPQSLSFSVKGLSAGIYLIRLNAPGTARSGVFAIK